MAANKNHKFEVRLSMDGDIIASRARWVSEYPESIIYSLRLNKLMNDMCDLVEDALRENDIERAWGIIEGMDKNVRRQQGKNKSRRRERQLREGERITK
jgi:hypothetical protein